MEKQGNTTHVIFDMGQTISDFVSNFNVVLREYANKKGKQNLKALDEIEYTEFNSLLDAFKHFLIIIGDDNHKDPDKLKKFYHLVITRVMELGIPLMPGVDKLIRHLHQNNIPMAIATDCAQQELEIGINQTIGLDPALFSHFVAGDDPEVKNNKPAPDIYLVCANRFHPPPKSIDNCVIFEDAIRIIPGAVATGMKTVLINKKPVHELGAIADKITVIVDSLENFRPESVGLPPF